MLCNVNECGKKHGYENLKAAISSTVRTD